MSSDGLRRKKRRNAASTSTREVLGGAPTSQTTSAILSQFRRSNSRLKDVATMQVSLSGLVAAEPIP